MTSISPAFVSGMYQRYAGAPGIITNPSASRQSSADRQAETTARPTDQAPYSPLRNPNEIAAQGRRPTAVDQKNMVDQILLRELQVRDREVRAHEQAHLAAAGPYARGGASFVYQRGPDGRLYAVGGEVAIDISREATPEATIVKMQAVRQAALAPANPSAADRQIAAQASMRLAEAQQQLRLAASETQGGNRSAAAPDGLIDRQMHGEILSNRRMRAIETYRSVNELL